MTAPGCEVTQLVGTPQLPLTARQAVALGECSGQCLVADPDTQPGCDCTCQGAHHGALAHMQLANSRPRGPRVIDTAQCTLWEAS